MKRRGILKMSPELLSQLLRLPTGVQVIDCRSNWLETFEFKLTGDQLPKCPEGQEIEDVSQWVADHWNASGAQ